LVVNVCNNKSYSPPHKADIQWDATYNIRILDLNTYGANLLD